MTLISTEAKYGVLSVWSAVVTFKLLGVPSLLLKWPCLQGNCLSLNIMDTYVQCGTPFHDNREI